MAGAEADLTIVVKAKDATRAVLDKVKGTIGTIGKGVTSLFLAPVKLVAGVLEGIYKRFFNLKNLLVGGAVFALLSRATAGAAKNPQEFVPRFTDSDQARINKAEGSWNRMVASFTHLLALGGAGLGPLWDKIGNFLRDHKQDIVDIATKLKDVLATIIEIGRFIANGSLSIGDLLGFKGTNMLGIPQFSSSVRDKALSNARAADLSVRLSKIEAKIAVMGHDGTRSDISEETIQKKIALIIERLTTVLQSTGENFGGGGAVRPKIDEKQLRQMAILMAEFEAKFKDPGQIRKALDATATAMAKAFGDGSPGREGLRALVGESEDAAAAIDKVNKKLEELATSPINALVQLTEVAQVGASRITDSFFSIIDGSRKVWAAIRSMVGNILSDLGRLLAERGLLNLLGSALGLNAGQGSAFGLINRIVGTNGLPARAGGGRVRRGQPYWVGERGPEPFIPDSDGQIVSNRNARGGGSFAPTFHIYDATDPERVAQAVMKKLQSSTQFRGAFAR